MHYRVKQVRIKRRCWPTGAPDAESTMVCPLCALEKHQDTGKTAAVARNGYIHCDACNRFSAIFTDDGVPVLPSSPNAGSMRQFALAQTEIRTVLGGEGDVQNTFALDEHPVEISFRLDKIALTPDAAVGGPTTREPETKPGRGGLFASLPALHILARGNLSSASR